MIIKHAHFNPLKMIPHHHPVKSENNYMGRLFFSLCEVKNSVKNLPLTSPALVMAAKEKLDNQARAVHPSNESLAKKIDNKATLERVKALYFSTIDQSTRQLITLEKDTQQLKKDFAIVKKAGEENNHTLPGLSKKLEREYLSKNKEETKNKIKNILSEYKKNVTENNYSHHEKAKISSMTRTIDATVKNILHKIDSMKIYDTSND